MSDSVRLLSRDGKVSQLEAAEVSPLLRINGEADPADPETVNLNADTVVIDFNGVADGRGFSLIKALRDSGFEGKVYAGGFLNPDQLPMVCQTGYDGALISVESWQDYGEESWLAALTPLVNLSYSITGSSQHRSIWQARHSR